MPAKTIHDVNDVDDKALELFVSDFMQVNPMDSIVIEGVNQTLMRKYHQRVIQPLVDANRFHYFEVQSMAQFYHDQVDCPLHTFAYVVDRQTLIYVFRSGDFTTEFMKLFRADLDGLMRQLNEDTLQPDLNHPVWNYTYTTHNDQLSQLDITKNDYRTVYSWEDEYENGVTFFLDNKDYLSDHEKAILFDALSDETPILPGDTINLPEYMWPSEEWELMDYRTERAYRFRNRLNQLCQQSSSDLAKLCHRFLVKRTSHWQDIKQLESDNLATNYYVDSVKVVFGNDADDKVTIYDHNEVKVKNIKISALDLRLIEQVSQLLQRER